jgi:hypothetical protein
MSTAIAIMVSTSTHHCGCRAMASLILQVKHITDALEMEREP